MESACFFMDTCGFVRKILCLSDEIKDVLKFVKILMDGGSLLHIPGLTRSREGLTHHPLASGIPLLCFAASQLRGGAGGRSVRSRTEGCSQAFGVLRPTMVLSAKVQSRNGGVTSVQSSNLWTFGHPCVLQALTGSARDVEPNFTVCPAPVAE